MQDIKIDLTVKEVTVEECIQQGFKTQWMEGEDEDGKFVMYSGAGCGSPWLQMQVGDKHYAVNMSDLFQEIITKARS